MSRQQIFLCRWKWWKWFMSRCRVSGQCCNLCKQYHSSNVQSRISKIVEQYLCPMSGKSFLGRHNLRQFSLRYQCVIMCKYLRGLSVRNRFPAMEQDRKVCGLCFRSFSRSDNRSMYFYSLHCERCDMCISDYRLDMHAWLSEEYCHFIL